MSALLIMIGVDYPQWYTIVCGIWALEVRQQKH